MGILVDNATIHAGQFRLQNASLCVPTGEYGVLMGSTGCGKTTLLEAIAGLKTVSSGRILLNDADVTRLKPAERNIGYVPQDGALFSTMKVREQLAFSLVIRRCGRREIERRVRELAALLQIEHLLERSIHGLSGGEKQRVALGRALAFRPATLCLDEPLSALDDATRQQMYELLFHVQRHTAVTILHVTHHLEDAQRLAQRFYHLEQGRLVEKPVDALAGFRSLNGPGEVESRSTACHTTPSNG